LLNAHSCCPSAPVPLAPARPAARLNVYGPNDPGRAEVEAFIQGIYAKRFGAVLRQFAPTLVGLSDAQHGLVAAAGYRPADAGPLFLERYLSAPVDQLLLDPSGRQAKRQTIAEVGHLAAARAGEGRRLILLMGPHLAAQGFDWVVSTLTTELRHLFLRIGVTPLALGVADPSKLGDAAQNWGSYYEHHPVVLAGNLTQALQQLARRQGEAGV